MSTFELHYRESLSTSSAEIALLFARFYQTMLIKYCKIDFSKELRHVWLITSCCTQNFRLFFFAFCLIGRQSLREVISQSGYATMLQHEIYVEFPRNERMKSRWSLEKKGTHWDNWRRIVRAVLSDVFADGTFLISAGYFLTFSTEHVTGIFGEQEEKKKVRKMATGYDDCYDASWHLIPPDYISNEEDYR